MRYRESGDVPGESTGPGSTAPSSARGTTRRTTPPLLINRWEQGLERQRSHAGPVRSSRPASAFSSRGRSRSRSGFREQRPSRSAFPGSSSTSSSGRHTRSSRRTSRGNWPFRTRQRFTSARAGRRGRGVRRRCRTRAADRRRRRCDELAPRLPRFRRHALMDRQGQPDRAGNRYR